MVAYTVDRAWTISMHWNRASQMGAWTEYFRTATDRLLERYLVQVYGYTR